MIFIVYRYRYSSYIDIDIDITGKYGRVCLNTDNLGSWRATVATWRTWVFYRALPHTRTQSTVIVLRPSAIVRLMASSGVLFV